MSKPSSPTSHTDEVQMGPSDILLEEPLKFIGFAMERVSPQCVQGRFVVSEASSQVFGVLHGGVSALIAESVASLGAVIASGLQRAAGLQLSINHLSAAPIGTEVFVSAEPVRVGKTIQVWDVSFSKVDKSSSKEREEANSKLAMARVTLMTGLTGQTKDFFEKELKKHARL